MLRCLLSSILLLSLVQYGAAQFDVTPVVESHRSAQQFAIHLDAPLDTEKTSPQVLEAADTYVSSLLNSEYKLDSNQYSVFDNTTGDLRTLRTSVYQYPNEHTTRIIRRTQGEPFFSPVNGEVVAVDSNSNEFGTHFNTDLTTNINTKFYEYTYNSIPNSTLTNFSSYRFDPLGNTTSSQYIQINDITYNDGTQKYERWITDSVHTHTALRSRSYTQLDNIDRQLLYKRVARLNNLKQ